MSAAKNKTWLLLLLLPLGFAGIWRLQHSIDAQQAAIHQNEDELLLRSGKLLKVTSLEYTPLLADVYWTRVVQYYGSKHSRPNQNLDLLWPLLDVTTTLDPNLVVSYRFGATFLAEAPPRGAGRPDLAIQLIERGIRANPEYWRFYEDLGFVYYFELKDYKKASAAFLEGSKNPAAAIWMKVLAAKVAEEGASRETSAFLWNEIYQTATDAEIKKNAQTHLELIQAEVDCEKLNEIAADYEKRFGHRPASMRDLVNANILPAAPLDPRGFVYVFGENGKAQLNPASSLSKDRSLYEKPIS